MADASYLGVAAYDGTGTGECHLEYLIAGMPLVVALTALAFGQAGRRPWKWWHLSSCALIATAALVLNTAMLACFSESGTRPVQTAVQLQGPLLMLGRLKVEEPTLI